MSRARSEDIKRRKRGRSTRIRTLVLTRQKKQGTSYIKRNKTRCEKSDNNFQPDEDNNNVKEQRRKLITSRNERCKNKTRDNLNNLYNSR